MSSMITIRSRCHEAIGTWVPEPGSPKYMRDLMIAKRRAAKQTQSKRKAKEAEAAAKAEEERKANEERIQTTKR